MVSITSWEDFLSGKKREGHLLLFLIVIFTIIISSKLTKSVLRSFWICSDPEKVYCRKPELSVEEIGRQAEVCKELIENMPDGFIIDTDKSLSDVVYEIEKLLIRKMIA